MPESIEKPPATVRPDTPARRDAAGPAEAILVPVKRLADAKQRLSLGAEARRALSLAMLTDVLGAAAPWPLRIVVTADPSVAGTAAAAGWVVVDDPGTELNGAVEAGTLAAAERGAAALLVLPFDVPLVSADDLAALFAEDAEVVVCRSDDGGTTGLLRRPPTVVPTAFGPASAARHAATGRAAGLRVSEIRLPGLALDVDDLDDLRLLAATPSRSSAAVLARQLLEPTATGP